MNIKNRKDPPPPIFELSKSNVWITIWSTFLPTEICVETESPPYKCLIETFAHGYMAGLQISAVKAHSVSAHEVAMELRE